jgi:hypothetical protein
MGVQPPSDGVAEEPDVVEFGIAALDAALDERDVAFPIDADSLERAHGDLRVPVDAAGNDIRLATALERTDRTRFESEGDLLEALHPVFEAEREAVSNSFIAQLRGLFPF